MKKVGGWRSSNGRRRVAMSLHKDHASAKATLIRVSGKLRGLMNGSGRDGAMEISFNLNSYIHSRRQNYDVSRDIRLIQNCQTRHVIRSRF